MEMNTKLNGTEFIVELSGRLDTGTAPLLEKQLKESIVGVKKIVIDMKALEYVSSAGLRVILSTQKQMNKQGEMIIMNVNDMIMEVFEVTGFIDILNIVN